MNGEGHYRGPVTLARLMFLWSLPKRIQRKRCVMEIAMRWVYQQVKDGHGIALEAGQKPSLCFKGRKYMLCLVAGHPVRVIKRPVKDFESCRQVFLGTKEVYPIPQAVDQFTRLGASNGITEGAKMLLQRAADMVDNLDEDEFNDEENLTMRVTSEKPAEEVTEDVTSGDNSGNTPDVNTTVGETTSEQETATMATKKKAKRTKKDKPAKTTKPVKAKSTKAKNGEKKVYTPRPESKIGKAVAFMREELKKAGGPDKVERGFLKDLFEKTAKKTGVAVATASTQYNRQIRSKAKAKA